MTKPHSKPQPPERIYNWLHSQMSVARFYGGLTYQGCSYAIAWGEPEQPLVRADVLKREAAARKQAQKEARKAAREEAKARQPSLSDLF